ncbi:hypothetical protein E2C01_052811 [Portunus trituberculatus]|uniref:Uncharacterized protein n=1 Tax=Portunus trituberculatus TaxID=210409 RepID=A0A5B7GIN3_PORTR|nr:hypothetical protein [Portunus trituberculatus]
MKRVTSMANLLIRWHRNTYCYLNTSTTCSVFSGASSSDMCWLGQGIETLHMGSHMHRLRDGSDSKWSFQTD